MKYHCIRLESEGLSTIHLWPRTLLQRLFGTPELLKCACKRWCWMDRQQANCAHDWKPEEPDNTWGSFHQCRRCGYIELVTNG